MWPLPDPVRRTDAPGWDPPVLVRLALDHGLDHALDHALDHGPDRPAPRRPPPHRTRPWGTRDPAPAPDGVE